MERFLRRRPCGWLLALLVIALAAETAPAQTITGTVLDESERPLPDVHVVIPALERGTTTDEEGRFRLVGLPATLHEVMFRYVGFVTERRRVDLHAGDAVLDVVLRPETIEAGEVLVTSERDARSRLTYASRSVARLEAKDLDAARGQTLGETLAKLPGVTTLTTGPSIAKPVVRGLHSQRLVVLNAGIPQEGQQWGGEHAPEIDPFAPARIEVIKGAASVEYGVGAIGGVIRVEPRALPAAAGVGGQLMLNGFSNNFQGAGSLLLEGGAAALPGLGWRVQGSLRKAGDARTPDYVIGNSAFEELSGSVALGYRGDGFNAKAYYSRFSTDLGVFRGAHCGSPACFRGAVERGRPAVDYEFSYDIGAPKQDITHDLLALEGDVRLAGGDQVEVQYGLQRNHRQEFDAHGRGDDPLDRPAFDLTLATHTVDAKLRLRPRGEFFGVVGLSGMNQGNVNGQAGILIPNFRALTGGAFAHGSWVRGDWTVEAGARFDTRRMRAFPRARGTGGDFVRDVRSYGSLSGVIGVIWRFAPAWSVAVNAGTGWRPPSVNELYSRGVHHGTARYEIGDANLTSERSLSTDVTLRHERGRTRLEVSVYRNGMNDYIFLFPSQDTIATIRGTFPVFRYEQADAVLRGVDGLAEVQVTGFLRLGATASLIRGDNLDADAPLINMPADRLALNSTWSLPDAGRFLGTAFELGSTLVRKQTRVPENADYAEPPGGYALFRAGLRTEVWAGATPVRLSLSVHNLLNTTYRDYLSRFRYFIDEPGRSIVLRVQVPLGASDV